jgi:hypothetical protein
MSARAVAWVLSVKLRDSTRKLVLVGLADHANLDGTAAFPSQATLADYAECSVRQVRRHLACLLDDGWIVHGDQELVKHYRADRRPVVYDLNYDRTSTSRRFDDGRTSDVATGGHAEPERADIAMSDKPSLEPSIEPSSALIPTDATTGAVVQIVVGDRVIRDYFDDFWTVYPRKVGKPAARRAWNGAVKRAAVIDIAEGLRRWVEHWRAENRPEFIPHPSTWLNQDRWDDEPTPASKPRSKTASTLDALNEHARREAR